MRAFAVMVFFFLGACARQDLPAQHVAATAAPASSEASVSTNHSHELDWLSQLVKELATGTMTREEAIAFLGEDAGPDSSRRGARLVRPREKMLASASVYPLDHIDTPVAIEIAFAPDAMSTLDELAAKLGPFRPMPRAPDDFTSGDKLACYVERADTKTTVRIFAEQDRASKRIAKLSLDAYTSK